MKLCIMIFFSWFMLSASHRVLQDNATVLAYDKNLAEVKFPLIENFCATNEKLFDIKMISTLRENVTSVLREILDEDTAKTVKNNTLWNLKITQLKKVIDQFSLAAEKAQKKIFRPHRLIIGAIQLIFFLGVLVKDMQELSHTYKNSDTKFSPNVVMTSEDYENEVRNHMVQHWARVISFFVWACTKGLIFERITHFLYKIGVSFTADHKALEEIKKFYKISLAHLPAVAV